MIISLSLMSSSALCLFHVTIVTIVRRLRHLEDERLQLLQKSTNFQSKSVRYKMLAAKVSEHLLVFVIDTALVFLFFENLTFCKGG